MEVEGEDLGVGEVGVVGELDDDLLGLGLLTGLQRLAGLFKERGLFLDVAEPFGQLGRIGGRLGDGEELPVGLLQSAGGLQQAGPGGGELAGLDLRFVPFEDLFVGLGVGLADRFDRGD